MVDFSQSIQIKGSKITISSFAIIIVGAVWLITLFGSEKWECQNTIKDDVIYYYSYLPATFIYHDISFGFVGNLPSEISDKIWLNADTGIPKMTMGLSIMYFPFFLFAHLYSSLFALPNGYSSPYHIALLFAGLFYGLIGLAFLKRILLKYFNQIVVAFTIVCLGLGTNLYHYAAYEGAMSHVYSFCIFAAFVYYSMLWNKETNNTNSILLGFLGGLIVLIRPVNAPICILPFLVNVESIDTFKQKVDWLIDNFKSVSLIILSAFLIIFPQLLYWKITTDNWLYYGYGNEGFYLHDPHIIEGLFSYRKGWLLYTPMMVFSILGLFKIKHYCSNLYFFSILYIPINIYIVFSWWCWWYGGSFGARALVESYVVLAFPLSVFISYTMKSKYITQKYLFGVIAIAFLLLNIFQSKQYDVAILHWDGMTKEAYWAIWGQAERPENYLELIRNPDYENALLGKEELINGN